MNTAALLDNTSGLLNNDFLADLEAQALVAEQEEAAAATLKALEEPAPVAIEATPGQAAAEEIADVVIQVHVPGTVKELVSNVTPEQRDQKALELRTELQTRIDAEKASSAGITAKMLGILERGQKELTIPGVAAILHALDIDSAFVNRSLRNGDRFNVYALDKIREVVAGLGLGFIKNEVIRNVLISMFRFQDAGLVFTGDHIAAAISKDWKVDRKGAALLSRHTMSSGTAPTQKSQMSNLLQVLGIATSNKRQGKLEVFTLTDTPQTRRLKEILMPAAA